MNTVNYSKYKNVIVIIKIAYKNLNKCFNK